MKRLNHSITKDVRFPLRLRRDGHFHQSGAEKRRWPNPIAAEFVATIDRDKGRSVQSYACWCGGWHVGTVATAIRWERRTVHRVPDLLVELGDRALAQMMTESRGRSRRRRQVITERAHAAHKRAVAA